MSTSSHCVVRGVVFASHVVSLQVDIELHNDSRCCNQTDRDVAGTHTAESKEIKEQEYHSSN